MNDTSRARHALQSPATFLIIGAGSRGLYRYGQYIQDHPEEAKVVGVAEHASGIAPKLENDMAFVLLSCM